jgi:hypothetical protein
MAGNGSGSGSQGSNPCPAALKRPAQAGFLISTSCFVPTSPGSLGPSGGAGVKPGVSHCQPRSRGSVRRMIRLREALASDRGRRARCYCDHPYRGPGSERRRPATTACESRQHRHQPRREAGASGHRAELSGQSRRRCLRRTPCRGVHGARRGSGNIRTSRRRHDRHVHVQNESGRCRLGICLPQTGTGDPYSMPAAWLPTTASAWTCTRLVYARAGSSRIIHDRLLGGPQPSSGPA